MRDGSWKLLINPARDRVELGGIPNDPTELTNLAEKHPGVVDRQAAQATEWPSTLADGPVSPRAGSNDYARPKPSAGS